MSGHKVFVKKDVKCPFYHSEAYTDIRCEGVVSKNTTLNFQTKKDKFEYRSDFCEGLYQSCVIYQLIMEKYDN